MMPRTKPGFLIAARQPGGDHEDHDDDPRHDPCDVAWTDGQQPATGLDVLLLESAEEDHRDVDAEECDDRGHVKDADDLGDEHDHD